MKRATIRNLAFHGSAHTRINVESSPLRFRVGETIEVEFSDVIVSGLVLSAKRIGVHPATQLPRAVFTVQVAVEAEGDAEACVCLTFDPDPDCPAAHAATVDLDDVDLHF